MQLMRVISALTICGVAVFYSSKLFGMVHLDQMMTVDEQKKTGVAKLTEKQKKELEAWINNNFVLKTATHSEPTISLQVNRYNGKELLFSNNTLYEIAPADRTQASTWLSVIVTIEPSGDPAYPWKITNTVTKVSVKGKLIPISTPGSTPKKP